MIHLLQCEKEWGYKGQIADLNENGKGIRKVMNVYKQLKRGKYRRRGWGVRHKQIISSNRIV